MKMTSRFRPPTRGRILEYVLVVFGLYFIGVYLAVALLRIDYPFELEWMEGGTLEHVHRILSGKDIYCRPSLEFVPFLYTPLYYYVASLISKVIGFSFVPLRLLALVSSLITLSLIFNLVRRETSSVFAGFLSVSLWAATYRNSGAWFDLARVDSLFLFFLIAGIYVLRFAESWKSLLGAGILLGLSFMTKQAALIVIMPTVLAAALKYKKLALWFLGGLFLTIVCGSLLFEFLSDGWFTYYIYRLGWHHPIAKHMILGFWHYDIFQHLSFAALFATVALLFAFDQQHGQNRFFYPIVLLGAVFCSYVLRLHAGGYLNVLMPVHALLAILFGIGFHRARQWAEAAGSISNRVVPLILAIAGLQFALLVYNPSYLVPTEADVNAGHDLVRRLEEAQGDVLIPYHSYLATQAHKPTHAHGMAVLDILRADDVASASLGTEISSAISSKRSALIILDQPWFEDIINQHYIKRGPVFSDPNVFHTVTGYEIRPDWVYEPRISPIPVGK